MRALLREAGGSIDLSRRLGGWMSSLTLPVMAFLETSDDRYLLEMTRVLADSWLADLTHPVLTWWLVCLLNASQESPRRLDQLLSELADSDHADFKPVIAGLAAAGPVPGRRPDQPAESAPVAGEGAAVPPSFWRGPQD